jgi:hypothetical protein
MTFGVKRWVGRSRKIIILYLLYFFYIIITILLFYDLVEVRIMSRIRVFGTNIASLAKIITNDRNSRRGDSRSFCDLFRT